ncbi:MAG: hypothetical protein HY268_07985 [Deltaproteobacteria bacterium]|nr:hypothetical protein [Deltaproteobacteria bacterium]
MAEAAQTGEDKSIEKAVWHYVGVGVLWISLLLTGMALERLGLTSSILSGILPGEVGSLQAQTTECERKLGTIKLDRDNTKHEEAGLRVELKKLQDQLAASQK